MSEYIVSWECCHCCGEGGDSEVFKTKKEALKHKKRLEECKDWHVEIYKADEIL